jgi:hypothetical protein
MLSTASAAIAASHRLSGTQFSRKKVDATVPRTAAYPLAGKLGIQQTSASRDRTDGPSELNEDGIFEAFVTELHALFNKTACVTCELNAFDKGKKLSILRSCLSNLPIAPSFLHVTHHSWFNSKTSERQFQIFEQFLSDLPQLVDFTRVAIELKLSGKNPKQKTKDIFELVQHWRFLSDAALEVIRALETSTLERLDPRFSANIDVLSTFLTAAINGTDEYNDPFGRVVAPELPQRRSHPRCLLLQPGKLYSGPFWTPALVRDVSKKGFGCITERRTLKNERLKLILFNGRQFECRVAWADKGRIGLEMLTPLTDTDPLLIG